MLAWSRTVVSRLLARHGRSEVLPPHDFQAALLREQSRTDRGSDCFSLSVFRPLAGGRVPDQLGRYLSRRVRTTDVVGRLHSRALAVLLPVTDGEGAWVFAENVLAELSERELQCECEVFTYPTDWIGRNDVDAQDVQANGSRRNGQQAADTDDLGKLERVSLSEQPARLSHALTLLERPVGDLGELLVAPLPIGKRMVDILVSLPLLILLSPLFLLVAIAIKLTSPGPVIFRQRRAGLSGRPFDFYKFRSMYLDAEERRKALEESNEQLGPIFKIKRDPRITPVGRMLRKMSIDELPQFWNVLRGDMTLVGPRPPTLNEVPLYTRWQSRRLQLTGGLTCIWQVSGRS
ncbi:MAG: sugar transferase, partial [Planctomycetota bacterium]